MTETKKIMAYAAAGFIGWWLFKKATGVTVEGMLSSQNEGLEGENYGSLTAAEVVAQQNAEFQETQAEILAAQDAAFSNDENAFSQAAFPTDYENMGPDYDMIRLRLA